MPVQVQKLHVDVAVQGVTVDFCGNSQVRAYQVTASAVCLACDVPCLPSLHLLYASHVPCLPCEATHSASYIGPCKAWHSAHEAI